jgi:hypothetical protein
MPKKQNVPTTGLKKAKAKVAKLEDSTPKSTGAGYTQVRSKDTFTGTYSNKDKTYSTSTKFTPTVEAASDTTGEIRGYRAAGKNNKDLKKNLAKAESRGKAFIEASDQGKLFEGK